MATSISTVTVWLGLCLQVAVLLPTCANANEILEEPRDGFAPVDSELRGNEQFPIEQGQSQPPNAARLEPRPIPVHVQQPADGGSVESSVGQSASTSVAAVHAEGAGLTAGVDKIAEQDAQLPFALLGENVPAETAETLYWSPQNLFDGMPLPTPVLVVNGAFIGPTVCLTGAVHGDEINSIETIRQIMHNLDAAKLSGTVVGVPIVNQMGFRRGTRYLPDRRDLNRYFPGDPAGSSASRIAHSLFQQIIRHCDALVDLHTGSFHRTNIPQLRADLTDPGVTDLVKRFGDMVVLHSEGSQGMLRREAVLAGIPAVTLEAGESLRIQEDVVTVGVEQISAFLINLGMMKKPFFWHASQPVFLSSRWIRANSGGIFISKIKAGDKIEAGELLGYISDPITNKRFDVRADVSGKVIGMALNQVVLPGYAIYHVGIDSSRLDTEKISTQAIAEKLLEEESARVFDNTGE